MDFCAELLSKEPTLDCFTEFQSKEFILDASAEFLSKEANLDSSAEFLSKNPLRIHPWIFCQAQPRIVNLKRIKGEDVQKSSQIRVNPEMGASAAGSSLGKRERMCKKTSEIRLSPQLGASAAGSSLDKGRGRAKVVVNPPKSPNGGHSCRQQQPW